jgi:hypothetical protein
VKKDDEEGPSTWQCEERALYLAVCPGDVLFHVVLKKDDEEGPSTWQCEESILYLAV